ncbi:MAG: hypothetical protein AAFZ15_33850 [Bacteroidota bacterium]
MVQKINQSLDNRVFIQSLAALSPAELKAFKTFCQQSSTITERTKSLFEYIFRIAPNFEKLTEDKIHSLLFPDATKASTLLTYALHDLNELLRNWLIQKELAADQYLQNQLFIRACKKRFMHKQFFKKTQQVLGFLKKDKLAVPATWQKQYEINFQLFSHAQTSKNQEVIESLDAMATYLEMSFHGSRLRLICQKVLRKKILSSLSELEETSQAETLDFAKAHREKYPFFNLYFQLVQYLKKPNNINDLISFVKDYKRDRMMIERLDQSTLLFAAANSLNELTMKGDKTAAQIQFELFNYAFDNNLVLFDNEIGIGMFNNFCVAACEVKAFKIAKKMLKKYEPYFALYIREEFTNLMWGTIYYYERKYEKVELQLHTFQFKLPMFRIRSRNLLLKSLYERFKKDKTLQPLILSELVSLRKYIRKQNSLTEFRKNMYYGMISVIRKLTNVFHKRPFYREKTKKELMDYLNDETKNPISRNWLLEKVKQL